MRRCEQQPPPDQSARGLWRGPGRRLLTGVANRTVLTRRVAEAPVQAHGHNLVVQASIGLAVEDGPVDAAELVRRADAAMCEAKARGESAVAVASLHEIRALGAMIALDDFGTGRPVPAADIAARVPNLAATA